MKFCNTCGRAMARDMSSGAVEFRCHCGVVYQGSAADARVGGAVLGASETTEMYRRLIETAPFDRTSQQVARDCPCGLDYMTLVRVGSSDVIIYKCDCGHEDRGAAKANQ